MILSMNYKNQPIFNRTIILLILLNIISLIFGVYWLWPYPSELHQLKRKNQLLQKQYLAQMELQNDFDKLKIKLNDLHTLLLVHLKQIGKTSDVNQFYGLISSVIRAYHLKLLELKPQSHATIANLQKQIFHLKIFGEEKSIWLFLNSLAHYKNLIELIQIEITKTKTGIQLETVLAIYYDSVS